MAARPDLSLPARIKTSANYIIARLARIEGSSRNYEDMILLNQSGRVAEGIGACVLLVRGGRISTPPASEGALESITLDLVSELAASRASSWSGGRSTARSCTSPMSSD